MTSSQSTPSRADVLSELLDHAFDQLLWISEAPNRNEDLSDDAMALAVHAREALGKIEREDPDKEWTGP